MNEVTWKVTITNPRTGKVSHGYGSIGGSSTRTIGDIVKSVLDHVEDTTPNGELPEQWEIVTRPVRWPG